MTSKKQLRRSQNDWTFTGVEKQEFQQTKAGPEVTGPPRKRKRKYGRSECPRAKGAPHVWLVAGHQAFGSSYSTSYVCKNCGVHIRKWTFYRDNQE